MVSWNPQVAAARKKSGDCMSSELGSTRITPSRSDTTPPPAGRLDGAEVMGSGNLGTPCRRMHSETFSICAIACAEGGGPEPGRPTPPDRSFWHFACAALNTVDEGSTPAPSWKPPPGLGSGKFGKPLERMQLAYTSSAAMLLVPGVVEPELAPPLEMFVLLAELLDVVATLATDGDFEPPHPASTIVAATARSVSPPDRGHVVLLSRLLVLF